MRALKSSLLLAACVLFNAATLAAQDAQTKPATAEDNRRWDAVGRLVFGPEAFCAGSLITSDIVLTAAHCLFDAPNGVRIDPAEISFQAGQSAGQAEVTRGIRRVVIHPDYEAAGQTRVRQIGADLALVELDAPVRTPHIRSFRTQLAVDVGQEVVVVSYADGGAWATAREEPCKILMRDTDVLILDCDVAVGASGAPILARVGEEARIVSVISDAGVLHDRTVTLAAVMDGQLEKLIREFARTPAVAPQGNAARTVPSGSGPEGGPLMMP